MTAAPSLVAFLTPLAAPAPAPAPASDPAAAVELAVWDWIFVAWFLLVTTGVGLVYARRAGSNLAEYFLSGRNLPWWALGTSMVATTFAADTPLVVSGFVAEGGIARNWLWWSFLIGGTLTVFVFSRWWRRSQVFTEIELVALRYDGAAARALRGFKAVWLGLVVNAIIFGWVTTAMQHVLRTVLPGVDEVWSIGILIAITLGYAAMSGLWGVVATDVLQFAMAMVGAIVLAVLAVAEVGGLGPLVERMQEVSATHGRDLLAVFPTGWDAFTAAVMVLVLVQWWAVYYPGAEPGGGGYVAQRMLAAKDENHARAGTLWFIFAHYVLRPWPWILVALAAIALDPSIVGDKVAGEAAYPGMFRVLPTGLLGLVTASFLAAYMSTITTQLNLASSFLVNDLYLPFLARANTDGVGTERGRVRAARAALVLVTAIGCVVTWLMETAGSGWELLFNLTAGTGLVFILRWLWWRVNAWSEIAAIVASAVLCSAAYLTPLRDTIADYAGSADLVGPYRLLLIVTGTTITWLGVTLLTRPVSMAHLRRFYTTVLPGGAWGPVAAATGVPPARLRHDLGMWVAASALVFGALIGLGSALLLQPWPAVGFGLLAVAGGLVLRMLMRRDRMRPRRPIVAGRA